MFDKFKDKTWVFSVKLNDWKFPVYNCHMALILTVHFFKLRLGALRPRSVCLSVGLSVGPSSKNYKKLQHFTKPLKTLQNIRKC